MTAAGSWGPRVRLALGIREPPWGRPTPAGGWGAAAAGRLAAGAAGRTVAAAAESPPG